MLEVKTATKAIKTVDDAIRLYSKVLDRVVPWKAFNETLIKLDKYKERYSKNSAALIGEIKALMKDGIDAYYRASEFIFSWSNAAIPLLITYVKLFDDHTAEKADIQNKLLIEMLGKGVTELQAAQAAISESSMRFNIATGKLTTLNSRFQVDSDEQSEFFRSKVDEIRSLHGKSLVYGPITSYLIAALNEFIHVPKLKKTLKKVRKFYDKLKLKVEQAYRDVDVTKILLNFEILEIGDLKVQAKETRAFTDLDKIPELRDSLVQSAKNLIIDCFDYRRKHDEKANN